MGKNARLIVASGEECSDMRYAAGFSTPDEFIWFAAGGHRGVVMSPLEFNRATRQAAPGVTVHADAEFSTTGNRVEEILALAAKFGAEGFEVPGDFPLALADRLRVAGIAINAADGVFFPEREFKSKLEVSMIVRAQRIGEAGCRRAFDVLREATVRGDGVIVWRGAVLTSEILRAEIDVEIVRMGGLPTGTICAGGVQSSQPHNTGSGILMADAPIVMDIFPRAADTGYWGDLTRTVVKGKAPSLVKRAYDAVLSARELGKSLVGVGANPGEIHRRAAKSLEKAGFLTGRDEHGDYGFFHGLGHGVGLDIHEAPRLSPRNSQLLRGGEVVTVEPGVYYPAWGGIRLEDLMYVAPGGAALCLTELEDFLEIP
ncbi:MAG: M24 family metallopeptidase [Victivallaceae bacterium]|nr:M24 family metallopeptidase [Victivallaceae bacterium]